MIVSSRSPWRNTPPESGGDTHELPAQREARIMIADDMAANVRLLRTILTHAGYTDLWSTTDAEAVIDGYAEYGPDIVLLDLHMPGVDGLQLVKRLRRLTRGELYLPIVVLTGDTSAEARRETLDAGASDFVTKPYDMAEVLLRVRNLLEIRRLHRALADENRTLEERVHDRTTALLAARFEVLERLAVATEMRDDETGDHTRRVGRLSARLAIRLGQTPEYVDLIERVAALHDIGKIAIPDAILRKPGCLSDEEFAVMKTHTTIGASMLAGGDHSVIVMAERTAHSHHERWDGSGYPLGLQGDQIPLEGRIVAVADFFDAMTHDRVYRPAYSREAVLGMVASSAGTQFDPAVAAALLELVNDEP
jgi:putative two-component system response regulator